MCNCNNHKPLYDPCNKCNSKPCPPKEDCDCPVKDLSTDCVLYTGEDLECSKIVSMTPLTEVIQQIDEFVCEKFDQLDKSINIVNVGEGTKIYKGIDNIGRRSLKTLTTTGELVVLESLENTIDITIDEEKLKDVIEELIPEIPLPELPIYENVNIGDGLQIFSETEEIENTYTSKFKTIKLENGIGGVETTTLEDSDEVITIKSANILSSNLTVEKNEDGDIVINSPITYGIKQFYVNINYNREDGDGSINTPFRNIAPALNAMIGTGTVGRPQYENASIILQSNASVSQDTLNQFPKLQNKITVNTMNLYSEGTKYIIYFNGNSDYPIDNEHLITDIGVDGNQILTKSISIKISNITIQTGNKGVVRHRTYSNMDFNNPSQNSSTIELKDSDFTSFHNPAGTSVKAKNADGSDLTAYGVNVYVQDSIAVDTPHMYFYGYSGRGEGSAFMSGCTINGSSQVHLKVKDTTLNLNDNILTSWIYCRPTNNKNETNGIYLPKNDLNKVVIEDAYISVTRLYDTQASLVGGYNSFFAFIRTNLNSVRSSMSLSDIFVNSQKYNYIVVKNNIASSFSLQDSKLTGATTVLGAFGGTEPLTVESYAYIDGSYINNVKSFLVTKIRPYAVNATVNAYEFSSPLGFANQAAAVASGLTHDNVYFDTTTGSHKRVNLVI